jgi:hypothetical protein
LPVYVPLEALGVARATVDLVTERRGRVAIAFARSICIDPVATDPALSASDAADLAKQLIDAVVAMATDFAAQPHDTLPPMVARAAADAAWRDAIQRAFADACAQSLPVAGQAMVAHAWASLLGAMLAGLDPAPAA